MRACPAAHKLAACCERSGTGEEPTAMRLPSKKSNNDTCIERESPKDSNYKELLDLSLVTF